MRDKQFPVDRIHMVGHSLGGQLAGYTGRSVISKSSGSIKLKRLPHRVLTNSILGLLKILFRLSALDPAGPDFYGIRMYTEHITKEDAEFVDVIHTDGGFNGYPTSTGTADFWPNGGRRSQPGCIDSLNRIFLREIKSQTVN